MPTPLDQLSSTGALTRAGASELAELSKKRGDTSPTNAVDAAKNFESLMVTELLKTMRSTIPENEDGFAMNTVWGMFDEAISKTAAGGLGLAPMLARDLGATEEEVNAMTLVGPEASGAEARLRLAQPGASAAQMGAPTKSLAAPDKPARRYQALMPTTAGRVRSGVAGVGLPQPGLMPVEGVVSSEFGWRTHPISGKRRFHEGMDIAAPTGTEIRAVQAGEVRFAGSKGGYGNVVELEHRDGTITRYAHASRVHVRRGDKIEVGESIADVGQTGHATGPHLHFQVERGGDPIDPVDYLTALRANR